MTVAVGSSGYDRPKDLTSPQRYADSRRPRYSGGQLWRGALDSCHGVPDRFVRARETFHALIPDAALQLCPSFRIASEQLHKLLKLVKRAFEDFSWGSRRHTGASQERASLASEHLPKRGLDGLGSGYPGGGPCAFPMFSVFVRLIGSTGRSVTAPAGSSAGVGSRRTAQGERFERRSFSIVGGGPS